MTSAERRYAAASRPYGQTILELRNITMLYPGTVALNDVTLDVRAGECHGVIGKNGAGKTTMMNIISGLIQPSAGEIYLKGRPVKLSRKKSRKEGISIVTQEPQVIPDFTVAENLFYPDYLRGKGLRINWSEMVKRAKQTVADAGLDLNVIIKASDLSISEQQLLLVLKAFYVDENEIIILDEVTAALTQKDQQFLFDLIESQKARDKAILFISHRLSEIVEICDRVTVLRDSRKITTSDRAQLTEADLSRLIVGEDYVSELEESSVQRQKGEQIISVENLSRAGFFQNVSFKLHQGEIIGLAGLRGSGRTEILKTISGVYKADEGCIRSNGNLLEFDNPAQALKYGIAYLPEDRDQEGLVEILSVKWNLTLCSLASFTKNRIIQHRLEQETAAELIKTLTIRTASMEQEVRSLSGGNRQKVVVGRLMSAAPKVYLLDEPTKGVDIGAKKTILSIVRENLARTAGVVLTSPGLEDLMAVCDRILALCEGQIVAEFSRDEFNQGRIYMAMQGLPSDQLEADTPSDSLGE